MQRRRGWRWRQRTSRITRGASSFPRWYASSSLGWFERRRKRARIRSLLRGSRKGERTSVTHEYRTNHRHSLLPVKHRLRRNNGRRKDVFLSLSFSSLSLHSLQQNVRGCRSHVQRAPRRCRSRCPPALFTHVSLRTAVFLIAHIHEIERGVPARTSTTYPKIGRRSKRDKERLREGRKADERQRKRKRHRVRKIEWKREREGEWEKERERGKEKTRACTRVSERDAGNDESAHERDVDIIRDRMRLSRYTVRSVMLKRTAKRSETHDGRRHTDTAQRHDRWHAPPTTHEAPLG